MKSKAVMPGVEVEITDRHGGMIHLGRAAEVSITAEADPDEEIEIKSASGSTIMSHLTPGAMTYSMTVEMDSIDPSVFSILTGSPAIPRKSEKAVMVRPKIAYPAEESLDAEVMTTTDHERMHTFMIDMTRCEHGRHIGDVCGDCGGPSLGNPVTRGEQPLSDDGHVVIGYNISGHPYVYAPYTDSHAQYFSRIWLVPS